MNMASEILNEFHIPLITTTGPRSKPIPANEHMINIPIFTMNSQRFLPPGKDRELIEKNTKTKDANKAANDPVTATGKRQLKRKLEVEPTNVEGNSVVMFPGRDESYPAELNKLIQPLTCQLCKCQMTSMKSAKDHYESKSHDRHISAWLTKNYTEVGLETPPIKRLVKLGPTGPNAFHCSLCDLALTSSTHARQHFAGRKHQLVAQNRTKPSGAGYYDPEGKWVRTGTKAGTVVDDGRFGIGELFIKAAVESASTGFVAIETPNLKVLTNNEDEVPLMAKEAAVLDESLTCKVCKISVTSMSQIEMHRNGSKHQKNLRKLNSEEHEEILKLEMSSCPPATPSTELESELKMYRTPSGSFYCKLCNKAMNHISILQQHLKGKKHLKNEREPTD